MGDRAGLASGIERKLDPLDSITDRATSHDVQELVARNIHARPGYRIQRPGFDVVEHRMGQRMSNRESAHAR